MSNYWGGLVRGGQGWREGILGPALMVTITERY